jgi:hypothetical protein
VPISTLQSWIRRVRRQSPAGLELLPVSVAERGKFVEARAGNVVLRFEIGTDMQYVIELLRRLTTPC